MASIYTVGCCGWAELYGVQSYTNKQFHSFLAVARNYSKGAYFFASACETSKPRSCGASRFANALRKHKLGTVVTLEPFLNPNTRRYIIPFIWHVDRATLNNYCIENAVKPYQYYR